MTATTQRFTLEECFRYGDGTYTLYELVNGELVPSVVSVISITLISPTLTNQL